MLCLRVVFCKNPKLLKLRNRFSFAFNGQLLLLCPSIPTPWLIYDHSPQKRYLPIRATFQAKNIGMAKEHFYHEK